MTEEWKIIPYFIPVSGYWLPDCMNDDHEIRMKAYCKLACITEKKHSWSFTLSGKQAYNESGVERGLEVR